MSQYDSATNELLVVAQTAKNLYAVDISTGKSRVIAPMIPGAFTDEQPLFALANVAAGLFVVGKEAIYKVDEGTSTLVKVAQLDLELLEASFSVDHDSNMIYIGAQNSSLIYFIDAVTYDVTTITGSGQRGMTFDATSQVFLQMNVRSGEPCIDIIGPGRACSFEFWIMHSRSWLHSNSGSYAYAHTQFAVHVLVYLYAHAYAFCNYMYRIGICTPLPSRAGAGRTSSHCQTSSPSTFTLEVVASPRTACSSGRRTSRTSMFVFGHHQVLLTCAHAALAHVYT